MLIRSLFLVVFVFSSSSLFAETNSIDNPLIDADTFLQHVSESHKLRAKRRLTEAEFIAESKKEGVIILDARSAQRFKQLHIKNAVSLPFTEFTEATLSKAIPSKDTKILIYCNNNVRNSPIAFASKAIPASLNLSTYTSLYTYGYRNVYELGPLIDPDSSEIEFVGQLATVIEASANQ